MLNDVRGHNDMFTLDRNGFKWLHYNSSNVSRVNSSALMDRHEPGHSGQKIRVQ